EYEPFGRARVNIHSSAVNNIRFPGQYYDQETGFHYNYHRYYDPQTGRYLTPDPIGLAGGMNLYAYVGNDPVNGVDPIGLARWKGYLTITSGGEVYGGGILIGAFESEGYNGKKAKVIVVGAMGGVTAGLPVSTTTGEITLVTPGEPNPGDFFGAISFVSANAGLVRTGGASYVEIGLAKSENIFSFQYGFDASTSGYVGWAFVVGKQLYEVLRVKKDPCE
ncbi:MAG: RHS repeat-associated core domain-containing protein, partial [Deltaproteobacteria bacterium]|nr:RHS repeat-associated core domain-containing protein [Deltaproteobacteria bacterium]